MYNLYLKNKNYPLFMPWAKSSKSGAFGVGLVAAKQGIIHVRRLYRAN